MSFYCIMKLWLLFWLWLNVFLLYHETFNWALFWLWLNVFLLYHEAFDWALFWLWLNVFLLYHETFDWTLFCRARRKEKQLSLWLNVFLMYHETFDWALFWLWLNVFLLYHETFDWALFWLWLDVFLLYHETFDWALFWLCLRRRKNILVSCNFLNFLSRTVRKSFPRKKFIWHTITIWGLVSRNLPRVHSIDDRFSDKLLSPTR